MYDTIVLGGGAAGIFAGIHACPGNVLVLEKTAQLLAKVRISGGGRCNVTHHCFDPKKLIENYPRGHKELLGPFHHFNPTDTIKWFESRSVSLKTEPDGRMFPTTDHSATIINCLLDEAKKQGLKILNQKRVLSIRKNGHFTLETESETFETKKLIIATGSSPQGYRFAQDFGHTIQKPIPSLFTFNIPTSPLLHLSGISLKKASLTLPEIKQSQTGPLLLTHFGFSGPAAIKLSAFGAPYLHEKNYQAPLLIDWLPDLSQEEIFQMFLDKKTLPLPKKLAKAFPVPKAHKQMRALAEQLKRDPYTIEGKTTNKEEFVTCGGVTLSEINFKTMESRLVSNLHFAGEILDIDGITGGFNFQNAWTTGYLSGTSK